MENNTSSQSVMQDEAVKTDAFSWAMWSMLAFHTLQMSQKDAKIKPRKNTWFLKAKPEK